MFDYPPFYSRETVEPRKTLNHQSNNKACILIGVVRGIGVHVSRTYNGGLYGKSKIFYHWIYYNKFWTHENIACLRKFDK